MFGKSFLRYHRLHIFFTSQYSQDFLHFLTAVKRRVKYVEAHNSPPFISCWEGYEIINVDTPKKPNLLYSYSLKVSMISYIKTTPDITRTLLFLCHCNTVSITLQPRRYLLFRVWADDLCMNLNAIVIMCTYEGLSSLAALLWYVTSPVGKASSLYVTESGQTMSPGDHTKVPYASFSLQAAGVPPLI